MKRIMLYFLALFLLIGNMSGYGQVKGKLSGKVIDEGTGEVLPGANVMITGIQMGNREVELQNVIGAATDKDGEYFILNIAPGIYTVTTRMIGYRVTTYKNIRISANLTTRLDFELKQTVLEGEEVTIVAQRELIRADVTSKLTTVSKEQIESMPLENFVDVLAVQPGFIKDEGGALHVRGGRGNEIAYMVDGVYISDPLYGEFSNLVLDKMNVQELQVLSGSFNAEYGRAMSGLVNIVTKDPARDFQWDFEYLSPYINESPYREQNAITQDVNPVRVVKDPQTGMARYDTLYYQPSTIKDFYDDWDKQNLLGQLRGSVSGGVPFINPLTYFFSGRYVNENSIFPHGFGMHREFMGKLVYQVSPDMKLSYMHQITSQEGQGYSHGYKYYNIKGSRAISRHSTELNNLIWTHTLSPSTFYNLRISRYRSGSDNDIPGLKVIIGPDGNPTYTEYTQTTSSEAGEFITGGSSASLQYDDVETYSAKLDITSQVTKHHQLKLGADYSKHEIDRFVYLNPFLGTDILHDYSDYNRKPYEGAFYFQDKIEYDYVILNLGLRVDYFNAADSMWADIYKPPYYYNADNELVWNPLHNVKTKWYISPRLGIAHPVTENTVIHFSYGFFYQRPDFVHLYYSRDITQVLRYPAGNPETEAQKTLSYEVGIKHQFYSLMALHLTGFYKDVFYLQGASYQNFSPYSYPIFDNSNYASLKGLELSIEKLYSHYYSTTVNYTLSFANTRESRAVPAVLYGASAIRPRRVFPASWDQRHVFGVNFIVSLPENTGPQLLGIKPLERLNFNFLLNAGSGFPYTPWLGVQEEYWRRELTTNSARKPWMVRVDLRAERAIGLFGLESKIVLKVLNLFDRRNSIVVESVTGRTWDPGPFYSGSDDALKNPAHYDTPRQIYLGLAISN
ncbi:TonB-dependent receptor [candidate division KSB1 bacterium]|nr:TonB-dependent receptor [candidate division KSB1 bacterium]